eukprot:TRINITY_DN1333_c0_g1_i5.p1 TRINITY_DN1333_c0_g1~~TRINITY_DN1333_c0_g1_i5.p1  ORF type:complete len:544 (-),score=80.71 TRINITY_DN1333_c0_g1_i5:434-1996(-)
MATINLSHSLLLLLGCCSFLVTLLAATTFVAGAGPSSTETPLPLPFIKVDPETHFLVEDEEDGRVRIFHGVNAIGKESPFIPSPLLVSEEIIRNLSSWGFNSLRLGSMWAGVEPLQGQYNQTYLTVLKDIVNLCADYGIYVLLDAHQDVYSPKLCGDGAPDWAVQPSNHSLPFAEPVYGKMPMDPNTGYPSDCGARSWFLYYFADATCSTFQNLYNENSELGQSFANFWKVVATTFSTQSNVIGYELINEPWAGDIYADPELLIPEYVNHKNLEPFYQMLASSIRSVDEQHIIFYEPVTWTYTESGFQSLPGGSDYANRSVLSYHYYCSSGGTFFDKTLCDDITGPDMFAMRLKDIDKIGGGSFLTEFGLCGPSPNASAYACNQVMNNADKYLQSWTYWDFSDGAFFDNGKINMDYVKMFSRTYPQAIAGLPISYYFDPNTAEFAFTFLATQPTSTRPTVIYLNEELHYPSGYNLRISTPSLLNVTTYTNYIELVYTSEVRMGDIIAIDISPTDVVTQTE